MSDLRLVVLALDIAYDLAILTQRFNPEGFARAFGTVGECADVLTVGLMDPVNVLRLLDWGGEDLYECRDVEDWESIASRLEMLYDGLTVGARGRSESGPSRPAETPSLFISYYGHDTRAISFRVADTLADCLSYTKTPYFSCHFRGEIEGLGGPPRGPREFSEGMPTAHR